MLIFREEGIKSAFSRWEAFFLELGVEINSVGLGEELGETVLNHLTRSSQECDTLIIQTPLFEHLY